MVFSQKPRTRGGCLRQHGVVLVCKRLMQSLFISSKDEMNVISMILTILASVYRLHGGRTRSDLYKYAIAPLIYLVTFHIETTQ